MLREISMLVTFIMLITWPVTSYSVDTKHSRKTLKGITRMEVIVERLAPQIEKAGLTYQDIKKDVVALLESAQFKILNFQERINTPGEPFLHVQITVLGNKPYVYSIRISFNQMVNLKWNPSTDCSALTWDVGMLAVGADLQSIRRDVKELMFDFLKAWHSVNQV